MALDPSIALGVRPIELPNQLAQYGQLAAIQNAQNQNALAQYQLSSAQRADEQQNSLYAAARQPNFKLDFQSAIKYGAPGIAAFKAQEEAAAAGLTRKKVQGEITAQDIKAASDRNDAFSTVLAPFVQNIQNKKPILYEDVVAQAKRLVAQGLMRDEDLSIIPTDQAALPQFIMNIATSTEKSRKALEPFLPKVKQQDTGSAFTPIQDNPMLPGYGLPVQGMAPLAKTRTFADITAEKQANTSAGQLSLAQQKFKFEKDNPGYELKEDGDGNFFGVNKRTLQSFPVMVGGGAVAPTAGAGMPGARTAPPAAGAVPAVGGAVAPTADAARQLVGKGTAMTETQSNAAMFGGAMAQAQNTIKQLEKSGTVKNAVVPSVLTGLAKLIPLGVGENIGNVIESTFNADPTGLIGSDAAQQKLAQAQLAFSTAYLRKTSGAAFGASEVANTIKEFFPLVGEGEKIIKQKTEARNRAIEGMKISTTKEGRKYIEKYGGDGDAGDAGGIPNATPNNPFGLVIPGRQ